MGSPAAESTPQRSLRVIVATALAAVTLLLMAAPASASLTHFLEPSTSFPFTGAERLAPGFAIDQANHFVYVGTGSGGGPKIEKFDTSGQPVNFSGLSSPRISLAAGASHLAVDGSGDIYASEFASHPGHIFKFLPSGEPDPTDPTFGNGFLDDPAGIGVDSSGNVFVANNRGGGVEFQGSEVVELSSSGEFIRKFGGEVFEGEVDGLVMDPNGNILVYSRNSVFGFEANGSCLEACQPIVSGRNLRIAVEPGTGLLYAIENTIPGTVREFASIADGSEELGSFGSEVLDPASYTPRTVGVFGLGLAVDGVTGRVYMSIETTTNGEPSINRVDVFGPNVVIPTLRPSAATAVQPTSVTLHGTINTAGTEPSDALTACHFDYVTEEAFQESGFSNLSSGGEAPCEPAFGSIPDDEADHPVSAHIEGLTPATNYHFRMFAENSNGLNTKEGPAFTSAGQPLVTKQAVDQIEQTAATLRAEVNPFELDTHATFEYISDAAFRANLEANEPGFSGATRTPQPSTDLGSGLGDVSMAREISGLQPGATYHYRVTAENSAAAVDGPDQQFTTVAPALFAAQPATGVGTAAATLQVYVNPLGLDTQVHFEYLSQQQFEEAAGDPWASASATATADAGEGEVFALQTVSISSLAPGTEYRFRAVGTNALGSATSPEVVFTTAPASCPNDARRAEDNSTKLPECRAYEMVSPVEKGLRPVAPGAWTPAEGPADRVMYNAEGSFAGDLSGDPFGKPYLARRGSEGWVSEALSPPPSLGKQMFSQLTGSDAQLTEFLTAPMAVGEYARNIGTTEESPTGTLYLRRADGSYSPASPLIGPVGGVGQFKTLYNAMFGAGGVLDGARDLSKLVLATHGAPLLPGEPKAFEHIYEIAGVRTTPELKVLNIGTEGEEMPSCAISLALGGSSVGVGEGPTNPSVNLTGGHQNEISADGSRVFFSQMSSVLPGGCGLGGVQHLFARTEGQATANLSEPSVNDECASPSCRNSGPESAVFQAASIDGSKAFFISAQQLTDGASPDGINLYEYDFNRPEGHNLVALSALQSRGVDPNVSPNGILGSADDGSLIYFRASGVLTSQPNPLGQVAEGGADNIYVVDTETGELRFIGLRCSGLEESGSVQEVAECPGEGKDALGRSDLQVTPDGQVAVFTTYAQLTPDDQNLAADVYRYDFATDSLQRVSIGHDGFDQNGNGGGQDAKAETSLFPFEEQEFFTGKGRVVSNDGETIVFSTSRPLQEEAEPGVENIYLWHQGQVSLISDGHGGEHASVGAGGDDVFFTTRQGLIEPDRDGLLDIYDARVGGGFPLAVPPPPICEGNETCHKAPGSAPAPPVLGTSEFRGSGNPPPPRPCKRGFVRRHGKCVKRMHHRRHRRAAHHHGGGK